MMKLDEMCYEKLTKLDVNCVRSKSPLLFDLDLMIWRWVFEDEGFGFSSQQVQQGGK